MNFEVTKRVVGTLAMIVCAGCSLFLLTGCVDDLYADCPLDAQSLDPAVAACAATDIKRGCVVENQTACETSVCARFQGSSSFCTQACASDGDCPDGQCLEFVFQTGVKYCVSNAVVDP